MPDPAPNLPALKGPDGSPAPKTTKEKILHWRGQGLTYDKIAERAGMTVAQVKTICHRDKTEAVLQAERDALKLDTLEGFRVGLPILLKRMIRAAKKNDAKSAKFWMDSILALEKVAMSQTEGHGGGAKAVAVPVIPLFKDPDWWPKPTVKITENKGEEIPLDIDAEQP